MRLGQTSVVYLTSKYIGSAAGFIATIYIANELGEEVLGKYALVLAIVGWLSVAGKVGLSEAVTKRISEGKNSSKYLGAGFLAMLFNFMLFTFIIFIARNQLRSYIGEPVVVFLVLMLMVYLFNSMVGAVLKGTHLVHVYAVINTSTQLIRSLLQISLVMVGFSLSGLLIGHILAGLLTGLFGLRYVSITPKTPSKQQFRSLFDFAKYSWLGSMRDQSYKNIDIFVLGIFVSPRFVGVYSVAWTVSEFLSIFGTALKETLFPEISKLSASNEKGIISGLVEDSIAYAGLFLLPGLVGALLIGPQLMRVYGEGFTIGGDVLWILILAVLIFSYAKQLFNALNALDRPDLSFRANLYFILFNIVLNFVFVYEYGWLGAGIATGISAGIGLAISYYYINKIVSLSLPVFQVAHQLVSSIMMGLLIILLRTVLNLKNPSISITLGIVVFGAFVYFSTLLIISGDFRSKISNNIPTEINVFN